MPKPKLAQIEGLSPAIAVEQKASTGNPRSTVGTQTETYDYLRILFAQAGTAYDPETQEEIKAITKEYVAEKILGYPAEEKIIILAPLELQKNEKFEDLLYRLKRQGFVRLRLNQQIYELDEEIPFNRKRRNEIALVIDRLKVGKGSASRLHEALENAARMGNGKILVAREEKGDVLFNLSFAVESTGKSYPPITPHTFSFNSPEGMCLECQGLGFTYGAHLVNLPDVMHLSLLGLLRYLWSKTHIPYFELFLQKEKIPLDVPLSQLPPSQLNLLLNGSPEETWMVLQDGVRFRWLGLQPLLAKAGKGAHKEIRAPLIPLLDEVVCSACLGSRLHPLARNVRIKNHSIDSLCRLPIGQVLTFLDELQLSKEKEQVLKEVLKQLKDRLKFILEVGLDYLSLDRKAPTLSNGEAQRIRLARQLGSHLTGVLYVLDEPTIGLHPHDNHRLNRALQKLKALNNTLLMVEHDPLMIAHADYIIDFGPGAGIHGGHITAQGNLQKIMEDKNSLTGAYLSGREKINIPKKRRSGKGSFLIKNAYFNNLKNLTFELPLGVLTCLTGVSGSGKSTLLHDVIRPLASSTIDSGEPFNKLIVIDQNPIGHTVRSDVGTYTEVLPFLREFYASLATARVKGLQPKHFSYNHGAGMCTHCSGLGYKKVEMVFLPPVKVLCEQCRGLRLNPVSLTVTYEEKNFGELLDMTIEEASIQFAILPKAVRIFETLISVGLGYLKLGQEMVSLSGGEAQRIKLSRELARRGTGKTLYLLDEPSAGLHLNDIKKLLALLHRLVDKGNTMVIIEHNLDIIMNADYIFDIGPGAGEAGGYIIAEGTPEAIAKNSYSLTGKYLKNILKK
jgi:excinuclease ABC subunit A